MSYYEALEDSIPFDRSKNGFARYYPPCCVCGSPTYSWHYIRGVPYMCNDCRKILIESECNNNKSNATNKQIKRLKCAVDRISRMTAIKPYADAISWVSSHVDNPGWFQSTEEIMTALELIRCGVVAHHQVTVLSYKVDFILPTMKVALEIDGDVFHGKNTKKQEYMRDELIKDKLGDGWEVVRISTDNINTNITKLLPAIKTVLARRTNAVVRAECYALDKKH